MPSSWVKNIIRVRSEYITACNYLDFIASKRDIDKREFMSHVFDYSLEKLSKKFYAFNFNSKKVMRIPKGFSISPEVQDKFNKLYNSYNQYYLDKLDKNLYTAEFTELLIYIFCHDNLSPDDITHIDINWGISES